jgi:lambda family phage minor tail protein L
MSNIIVTDLQSPSIEYALVELFELTLSDSVTLFFHAGVGSDLGNVKFHPIDEPEKNTEADANEYIALPIEMSGIASASDGASNRPTLSVANVTQLFRSSLNDNNFSFEDVIGRKITRRTTFSNYLVGGVDEDTPTEFPLSKYVLDRISSENQVMVTFELAAPFDLSGIKLPNRTVIGKYCSWIYQGRRGTPRQGGCSWSLNSAISYDGATYDAFFDREDHPLVSQTIFDSVATAWTAGTYTRDTYVTYSSRNWRCITDNNEAPLGSDFWEQVFTWTVWNSVTSYTVPTYGKYVKHNNHIWKSIRGSLNAEPEPSSVYWSRVDYCGKTLESCKCRYQFVPINGLPSVTKETNKVLPFGAFPGSAKFK